MDENRSCRPGRGPDRGPERGHGRKKNASGRETARGRREWTRVDESDARVAREAMEERHMTDIRFLHRMMAHSIRPSPLESSAREPSNALAMGTQVPVSSQFAHTAAGIAIARCDLVPASSCYFVSVGRLAHLLSCISSRVGGSFGHEFLTLAVGHEFRDDLECDGVCGSVLFGWVVFAGLEVRLVEERVVGVLESNVGWFWWPMMV